MNTIPESLKVEIRRHLAGLTETERITELARIVRPDIVGSEIRFKPNKREEPAYYFTDLRRTAGSDAVELTDQDRELIARCGLKPEAVATEIVKLRAERAGQERRALTAQPDDDEPLSEDERREMTDLKRRALARSLPPDLQEKLLDFLHRDRTQAERELDRRNAMIAEAGRIGTSPRRPGEIER